MLFTLCIVSSKHILPRKFSKTTSTLISFSVVYSLHCLFPTHSQCYFREKMFNEDDFYIDLLLCCLLYALPPPNTFSKLAVSQCKCLMTTYTLISSSVIYSMYCLLPTHSQSCFPMQMFNEDDFYVGLLSVISLCHKAFAKMTGGYLVRSIEPKLSTVNPAKLT